MRRMTAETFEYAIKKDVRNNPIVREVDRERHREMCRSVGDRRVPRGRCCCSRRGSTSSCCATATASSRCSRSAPSRTRSTAICGSRSRRCRSPARIERHRDRRSCTWWRRVAEDAIGDRARASRRRRRRGPSSPAGSTERGHRRGRPARQSRWRTTLKRRLARVRRPCSSLWAVGDRGAARLPAGRPARRAGRASAERQQSRTIEAPAKRGEILDRNGHVLAYSVDADTIYAVPTEIGDPRKAAARAVRRARRLRRQGSRRRWPTGSAEGKAFAYVRRQVSPEQARRVAALQLDGIGFMKENRRFYPNRSWPRTCSATSASTTSGWAASRRPTTRSSRAGRARCWCRPTRSGRRSAASSGRRRPGATLELTIDQYLQHIAERELRPASSGAARPAGRRSSWIRSPARSSRWPATRRSTRTPTASPRTTERRNRADPGSLRAGLDLQDRHRQRRARRARRARRHDLIDVSAGYIRFGSRVDPRRPPLRRADVRSTSIVKSSNVGAIKVGAAARPRAVQRLRAAASASAGRSRPTSAARAPGIVWDPVDADRQRAGVGR